MLLRFPPEGLAGSTKYRHLRRTAVHGGSVTLFGGQTVYFYFQSVSELYLDIRCQDRKCHARMSHFRHGCQHFSVIKLGKDCRGSMISKVTDLWSAIWGTHLGLTKAVASTCERPDATSLDMNSTLTFVGTTVFSFCNPSLGPTLN